MFKHLVIIAMLFFTFSCSTSKKMGKAERLNFITFDLRSYDILKLPKGWVACEAAYLKANKNKGLEDIYQAGITPEEEESCAMYKCEEDSVCTNSGSYLAFSEVVNFLLQKEKRLQYTSQKPTNIYDIDIEANNCFQVGKVNSCAILSAYYRYHKYNRSEFYRVRTKECELLGISQKNCSFDL